jgi:hypothetical protein
MKSTLALRLMPSKMRRDETEEAEKMCLTVLTEEFKIVVVEWIRIRLDVEIKRPGWLVTAPRGPEEPALPINKPRLYKYSPTLLDVRDTTVREPQSLGISVRSTSRP